MDNFRKLVVLTKWLNSVSKKRAFKNYTERIFGGVKSSDKDLGDITFVNLNRKTEGNKDQKHSCVMKSCKSDLPWTKIIGTKTMYQNEIYFYQKVLPTFAQFQEKKSVREPFNHFPECYYAKIYEGIEVMILKNMRKEGYLMHNGACPMSEESIRKIVQIFGKFHAISFALRDQNPKIFRTFARDLTDVTRLLADEDDEMEEDRFFVDLYKIAKEKKLLEISNKLFKLPNMIDTVDSTDSFAVIVHGDAEPGNFLFKYTDNERSKLDQVCFLDFQRSRLASPVYDLSCLLFSCMSGDDVKNFDDFNKLYYESLSDFLRQLGSDPDKMFPFDELENQWKMYGKFGLRRMVTVIKNYLLDQEDVFSLGEVLESILEVSFSTKAVEKCGDRIFPMIKLAIDKEMI